MAFWGLKLKERERNVSPPEDDLPMYNSEVN